MNELGKRSEPFFFLIDFELENIQIHKWDALPSNLYFDFGNVKHPAIQCFPEPENTQLSFEAYPYTEYAEAFRLVLDEINYGNSFLLNLTGRSKLNTQLSLEQIYQMSNAKYRLYLADSFVSYSPESFIQIKEGTISSFPMKGTIDASIENAKDIILADPKEKAEHNTIVDLIRNDMSRYAKQVHVPKYRYIDTIKSKDATLYQVSSEVKGQLQESYAEHIGSILFSMLPAGSVSGAPKVKTLEIIRRAEQSKRGYYTGVAGYFDGLNMDSCVLIRFIAQDQDSLYYHSGGGITFMSDVDKEYNELIQKIYVPTS